MAFHLIILRILGKDLYGQGISRDCGEATLKLNLGTGANINGFYEFVLNLKSSAINDLPHVNLKEFT